MAESALETITTMPTPPAIIPSVWINVSLSLKIIQAIRAVVKRLNSLLRLSLDISDLSREAEEFEAKLSFMTSHNPEFQAYVTELEKDFTEVQYEEPLDISARGAVRLAEEFLRKKDKD